MLKIILVPGSKILLKHCNNYKIWEIILEHQKIPSHPPVSPQLVLSFIKFNIKDLMCCIQLKSGVVFVSCCSIQTDLWLYISTSGWRDSFWVLCLVKSFPLLSPSHLLLQCLPLAEAPSSCPPAQARPSNSGLTWRKWFQNLLCMSFVTVFCFPRQVIEALSKCHLWGYPNKSDVNKCPVLGQ